MNLAPGVAAGHPATAEAGLEILEAGGSAADAAVAASLASCVAETVMTGIAGGGHAIWFDGATGKAELVDFFVTVPGLGTEPQTFELEDVG
ncbi:MAG: gamma-glutamyltransferase, partial [Gaiellaceae bacterium]